MGKVIQILYSPQGDLIALTDDGNVWMYHPTADAPVGRSFWSNLTPRERKEID